jgi:hypothetical protein
MLSAIVPVNRTGSWLTCTQPAEARAGKVNRAHNEQVPAWENLQLRTAAGSDTESAQRVILANKTLGLQPWTPTQLHAGL